MLVRMETELLSALLPSQTVYDAEDFGISPEAEDNAAAIETFFQTHSSFATLRLGEGTYRIGTCITIDGGSHLALEGSNNTVLLQTGAQNTVYYNTDGNVMTVKNTDTLTVRDIRVDYLNVPSFSGHFTGYDTEEKSATFVIDDGYQIRGDEFVWAVGVTDTEGKYLTAPGQCHEGAYILRDNQDGSYSFMDLERPERCEAGLGFFARMSNAPAVFDVYGSKNLLFEDIHITNAYMTGFICSEKCRNATFRGIKCQSLNDKAYVSVNGDGIDARGVYGEYVIENCIFERLADDAVNINSRVGVIKKIDGNKLQVINGWRRENNVPLTTAYANVGDSIRVYSRMGITLGYAICTGISEGEIVLDHLPPNTAKMGLYISNQSLNPSLVFRRNVVRYENARAVLAQTNDILIENNSIYATRLAAFLFAWDVRHWYEGTPCENVVIRANEIDSCGYAPMCGNTEKSASITLRDGHDDLRTTGLIHKNVLIENNVFMNVTDLAGFFGNTDGVTVRNNVVHGFTGENAFEWGSSQNVVLEGNEYLP